MKFLFSQLEIYDLDITERLLYDRKYDIHSLHQADAASVARELGIEEYFAKIIIDAARMKATEYFPPRRLLFKSTILVSPIISCLVTYVSDSFYTI